MDGRTRLRHTEVHHLDANRPRQLRAPGVGETSRLDLIVRLVPLNRYRGCDICAGTDGVAHFERSVTRCRWCEHQMDSWRYRGYSTARVSVLAPRWEHLEDGPRLQHGQHMSVD